MHFRPVVMALSMFLSVAVAAGAQTPQTPQTQTPPAPAGGGQRAGGAAPAPFRNLQVLPKDIPRPELTAIMQGFNAALGVQCAYCHQFVGPGNPGNDMASDDKTPKLVARVMMQMTTHVNEMVGSGVGKPAAEVTRVQCGTCHRGHAIPEAFVPPPAPTQQTPGH